MSEWDKHGRKAARHRSLMLTIEAVVIAALLIIAAVGMVRQLL